MNIAVIERIVKSQVPVQFLFQLPRRMPSLSLYIWLCAHPCPGQCRACGPQEDHLILTVRHGTRNEIELSTLRLSTDVSSNDVTFDPPGIQITCPSQSSESIAYELESSGFTELFCVDASAGAKADQACAMKPERPKQTLSTLTRNRNHERSFARVLTRTRT